MHAMPTPAAIQSRRAAFRALHTSGCFLIPNPWDVGSARYLANLGFKALATTSSGAAWAGGLPDGGMPLAQVLEHLRQMVAAGEASAEAPEKPAKTPKAQKPSKAKKDKAAKGEGKKKKKSKKAA